MGEINSPLVLILLLGGLAFLARRASQIRPGHQALPVTVDWIEEMSTERYNPMLRLLEEDEVQFLKAQGNFEGRRETEFRTERTRLFREYLGCLRADFEQMSMAIRILMVQSCHDRPDLARALVGRQAVFAVTLALVHGRLILYRWGICGVDARGLMRSFEAVRLELRALLPTAVAVTS